MSSENINDIGSSERDEDSGGGGFIVWILALLAINFLSLVFDWPFWVY
jgi:hypothetical protein